MRRMIAGSRANSRFQIFTQGTVIIVTMLTLLLIPSVAQAAPDLEIYTDSATTTAGAPSSEAWIFSVHNAGVDDADNVSVEVNIPVDATYSQAGSSAECSAVDSVVTCSLGTVVVDDAVSLTVIMLLPAPTGYNTYGATASVSTSTADDPIENNLATISFIDVSDLTIYHASSPATDVPSAIDWRFSVGNEGGVDAAGTEVAVTLPAEATFVEAGSSAECSAIGQTVTCILGAITPGSNAEFHVVFSVPNPTELVEYEVSAQATTTTEWDPPENNSVNSSVPVVPPGSTNLSTDVIDSSVLEVNGTGTQTIRIDNGGPNVASGATVTVDLPSGIGFDSSVGAPCLSAAGVVTCSLPDIASENNMTLTLTFSGPNSMPAFSYIEMASSLNYDNNYTGAARDFSLWTTLAPEGSVNLRLKRTNTNAASAEVDSVRTYSYKVTNEGPNTATGVSVDIVVPEGSTYTGFSGTAICTFAAQSETVTCALPDIVSGGQSSAFSVTISHGAPGMTTIIGSVTSNEIDFQSSNESWSRGNNTLYRYVNVVPVGSVDVGLHADWENTSGQNFAPSTQDTLMAVATNHGPNAASGVSISVPIPTGFAYDDATSSSECSLSAATVTCASAVPLNVDETYSANIKIQVPAALGSSNVAISVDSAQTDWFSENNDTAVEVVVNDGTLVDITSRIYPQTDSISYSDLRSGVEFQLSMWAQLDSRSVPNTATTNTVSTTLPSGVTFSNNPIVAKYPDATVCTINGDQISCSLTSSGDDLNSLYVEFHVVADEPGSYQFSSLGTTSKTQWQGHAEDSWEVNSLILAGPVQDACTNIDGFQSVVPNGYTDLFRVCTLVAVDQCPNLSGVQGSVLAGMVLLSGQCVGTSVNNVYTFGSGRDVFNSGGGNDRINGGSGSDSLTGGPGVDTLFGSLGYDVLNGGAGNDKLNGGPGKDTFYGNGGNDKINANDHKPGDVINCGSGNSDDAIVNRGDKVKGCEHVTRLV